MWLNLIAIRQTYVTKLEKGGIGMFDEQRAEIICKCKDTKFKNEKLEEENQKLKDIIENLNVEVKLYKDSLDRTSWD